MIVVGIARGGQVYISSDSGATFPDVKTPVYDFYFPSYDLKELVGIQKIYPIFYVVWYRSSDYGQTWAKLEQDVDCPFRADTPYITGIQRNGARVYSGDYGVTWTFYPYERESLINRYSWISGVLRTINLASLSLPLSLDYGSTWITTNSVIVRSVAGYIREIDSEVRVSLVNEEQGKEEQGEDAYSKLLSYLPIYERSSRVIQGLLSGKGLIIDDLYTRASEVLKQFFISTAGWGLDIWEEMLGLSKDVTLSEGERRRRILAKIQVVRGINLYNLQKVLIQLTEKPLKPVEDFEKSAILIKGFEEIPSNPLYLYTNIRGIIPAHLGIVFEYRLWDWLEGRGWTWDYFESLGLTWEKYEEVDEEWNILQD